MNLFGESHAQKEDESIINRLLGIIENLTDCGKKCPLHPVLTFNIFNNNKNYNYMAILTSLALTSVAPVDLAMVVCDANNNNAPIAGVLTGVTYTPTDPTQDIAVPDPVTPNEVDIHAVSLTGGTVVTANGTFVSTALQADGKTPVFSGPVSGTLTVTNNIPAPTLSPVLTFNQ